MFGARFNHETRFFSDGYELSGVESASLNYTNPSQIVKPLGTKQGFTVANGLPQRTLSLSRVLTYNDPILSHTGDTSISGNIYYDNRVYGFSTGHLVDYNLNCAVGSVPRVSTNFQIASELKSGEGIITPTESHPVVDIPTQGSISITSDGSTTNRVIGFDYSIKCNRKAYTRVDSIDIVKVEQLLPIEFSATVQIDVDDAFMEDSHSFFSEKENKNVQLLIDGRSGSQLQSLVIPNASLVGETLNASADGSLKLTLNYVGHTGSDVTVFREGLTYVLDSNGDALESTLSSIPASWMEASGDVYGVQFGANVNFVGNNAFKDCSNLYGDLFVKTIAPGGIGTSSFENCSGLNGNLILDEDIMIIGENAFYGCSNFVGDLIIPNQVNTISNSAFENCGFDGILKLPNSMGVWGVDSFKGCDRFRGSLYIPDENGYVGGIPSGSFEGCSGFDSTLYIGTGAEFIGENAFKNCTKIIDTLQIQDQVTGIKSGAFQNCHSLQGLDIGVGLTYVGHRAFKDCHEIESVLDFPNGLNEIQNQAFMSCSALGGVEFNTTISKIGDYAFSGCSGMLGGLTIPSTIDFVETGVFQNCSSLNGQLTLNMSSGCLSGAFKGCSSLVGDISFQNSVYSIGVDSFRDCSSLGGDLNLPDSLTFLGDGSFRNCGFTGNLNISGCTSLEEVRGNTFRDTPFGGQLILPEGLTGIKGGAFRNCVGFTGFLLIPTGISDPDTIWENAFRGCTGIRDIYIDSPDDVISESRFDQFKGPSGCLYVTSRYYDDWTGRAAGASLFRGMPLCRGSYATRVINGNDATILANTTNSTVSTNFYANETTPIPAYVDIGITCNTIQFGAFQYSSNLRGDLILPKSVNFIGYGGFRYCGFDGELIMSEGLENIGGECFRDCQFAGDLILPDSLLEIEDRAFQGCSGFDGVLSLGQNITGIGDYCFQDMRNISGDISIPTGVKELKASLFKNCYKINKVQFHDGITGIDNSTFENCSGLNQGVVLPTSLVNIGQNAFKECKGLDSLQTNQNLTNIGVKAFQGCDGILGSVSIPASVTTVGNYAFSGCSGIDAIYSYVPESVIGTDSLKIQTQAQSTKILYVTDTDYADYLSQGGGNGYYQGNLIKKIRTNINQTEYYDVNGSVINSTVASIIPNSWENGGVGHAVDFGNTVKRIGQQAFNLNNNLSGVVSFPISLTGIANRAFESCPFVDAYVFNEGLKYIEYQAFRNSDKIESVYLPSTLESVQYEIFRDTQLLSDITIGSENVDPITVFNQNAMRYMGVGVTNGKLRVNKSVSDIGRYCFYGNYKNWETVYLNCRTVGEQAFYSQGNITDLTFGPNLEVIGINNNNSNGQTFRACTGLTGVAIPNPKWVGYQSFYGCSNIESIYVGNNTDNTNGTIANEAFRYVGQSKIGLGYAWIGSSISNINYRAFYGDYDFLTGAYIGASSVGDQAFYSQANLEKVIFDNDLAVAIGSEAFRNCGISDELEIQKVSRIGGRAFQDQNTNGNHEIIIGNDADSPVGVIEGLAFFDAWEDKQVGTRTLKIKKSILSCLKDSFTQYYSSTNRRWITSLEVDAQNIEQFAFRRLGWAGNNVTVTFGPNVKLLNYRSFYEAHGQGDVVLARQYCTLHKAWAEGGNYDMGDVYVNTPLAINNGAATDLSAGALNIEDLTPFSYTSMTGDFYVHPQFTGQWKSVLGGNKLDGKGVRVWQNYPTADGVGALI